MSTIAFFKIAGLTGRFQIFDLICAASAIGCLVIDAGRRVAAVNAGGPFGFENEFSDARPFTGAVKEVLFKAILQTKSRAKIAKALFKIRGEDPVTAAEATMNPSGDSDSGFRKTDVLKRMSFKLFHRVSLILDRLYSLIVDKFYEKKNHLSTFFNEQTLDLLRSGDPDRTKIRIYKIYIGG